MEFIAPLYACMWWSKAHCPKYYTHCAIKMNIIIHCIMNNKFKGAVIQMSIKSNLLNITV